MKRLLQNTYVYVVYHYFTWANQSVHGLGRWYANFRSGKFRPGIAFTILYKSVSFSEKRSRRPKTGIKFGFEEMEHEFPLGLFRAEKQDYLFKCSSCPEKFPLERAKWSCSTYFPTGFSGNVLLMVNNHSLPRSPLGQKWLREGLQSTALNFRFEFRKIDLTVNPSFPPGIVKISS